MITVGDPGPPGYPGFDGKKGFPGYWCIFITHIHTHNFIYYNICVPILFTL
jgi:hypothetical protein